MVAEGSFSRIPFRFECLQHVLDRTTNAGCASGTA